LKKQDPGHPFVFTTAHANATVLGTRLQLQARGKSTRLQVDRGRVRFTRFFDGESVVVEGGFAATAKPGVALRAQSAVTRMPTVATLGAANALKAHFSFDAIDGQLIPDSSGSGRISARIVGEGSGTRPAAERTSMGRKGAALSVVNGTVEVDHHRSLTPQRLSIALWFRITEPGSDIEHPVLLGKQPSSGGSGYLLAGFDREGDTRSPSLRFEMWTDVGPREVTASVADGEEWNHAAVTFDGHMLRMFVNGQEAGVLETGPVRLVHNTERLSMGRFIGLLDEVRFYNRALTEKEIRELNAE
jgi:hypothetical protein